MSIYRSAIILLVGVASVHAHLRSTAFIVQPAASASSRIATKLNVNNYQNDKAEVSSDDSILRSNTSSSTRRNFFSKSMLPLVLPGIILANDNARPAFAADGGEGGDMTSQMFNEDGSLKSGIIENNDIEAKSRLVSVPFPTAASPDAKSAIVSIDGEALSSLSSALSSSGDDATMKATYELPEKWTAAPNYLDTLLSVQKKACDRVTVYQAPGTFKDNSALEKATTLGVAKALGIASTQPGVFPKTLVSADIVSGRKVSKAVSYASAGDVDSKDKKRKYFEFDLAVAPETCGASAENLNLGFCPYDTIVLLSATIVNERMMVCGVTCTKDEWKRSNADLKRVRGSFFVDEAPSAATA